MVLLDKDMYLSKMNELVSDASKFEKLCDPVDRYTVRMEYKVNHLLKKLKDCGCSLLRLHPDSNGGANI